MDITKKQKITDVIIFLFFILFPFGQLIRINFLFYGYNMVVQPIDLVAIFGLTLLLKGKYGLKLRLSKELVGVILTFLFSLLLSLTRYSLRDITVGLFYMLRLTAYIGLFYIVFLRVKNSQKQKLLYFRALLSVVFFAAIFGWLQYFAYPDTRALYYLGWDDHLYRLIGTYLDPGFTSILFVFGFILSLFSYYYQKRRIWLVLCLFFLLSLAFTYSRAGYLALFAGLVTSGILLKKYLLSVLLGISFVMIVIILPRPGGEGVKLERTYSIIERMENYQETFLLWKGSPLFGVGYNNLCLAKKQINDKIDVQGHSCSGSDSSILLILSTLGTVGFFIVIWLILRVFRRINQDMHGKTFIACFAALLVHSQFVNSLFYAWNLGFMSILLAISFKESSASTEE